MSTDVPAQFTCDGCGKAYRWKPELAGRKVKCKCGHAMTVPPPAKAPDRPAARPRADEDPGAAFERAMFDLADAPQVASAGADDAPRCPSCRAAMAPGAVLCIHCGYNVNTGQKLAGAVSAAAAPAAKVAKAVGPAGGAGVLGYKRNQPAPGGDVNHALGSPVRDLAVPIALVAAGAVLGYVEITYALRVRAVGVALTFLGIMTVINLALVFTGIMIGVKMMDLGLGPVGPALLKITAIAMVPGPVAGLIEHAIGPGGNYLGYVASLLLTYGMFMLLLDLDFQETLICTAIIWIIRTWIGYAITWALLGAMGFSAPVALGAAGPGAGPAPAKPKVTAKELDARAAEALAAPGAAEAKGWLLAKDPAAGAPNGEVRRALQIHDTEESVPMIDAAYAAGAKRVMATKFERQGAFEVPTELVLTLPDESEARQRVFGWADGFDPQEEFDDPQPPPAKGKPAKNMEPQGPDKGQKYLIVHFR